MLLISHCRWQLDVSLDFIIFNMSISVLLGRGQLLMTIGEESYSAGEDGLCRQLQGSYRAEVWLMPAS